MKNFSCSTPHASLCHLTKYSEVLHLLFCHRIPGCDIFRILQHMEFSNCLLLPVRMYLHFLRVLSWFDTVGPNYDPLQDYSSVKI